MFYMHNASGWWMVGGWILMVFIWGGLIALGILSFRWFTKHNASMEKQTPLEIAKERYAKGEITKEQYEQIKKDLS
jgi:putative membrane protein